MIESCGSCRFSLGVSNKRAGFCRRYPRQVFGGNDYASDRHQWPLAYQTDWCGEWRPSTQPQEKD